MFLKKLPDSSGAEHAQSVYRANLQRMKNGKPKILRKDYYDSVAESDDEQDQEQVKKTRRGKRSKNGRSRGHHYFCVVVVSDATKDEHIEPGCGHSVHINCLQGNARNLNPIQCTICNRQCRFNWIY